MIIELLDDFGFEAERFRISWVSSAEAARFAQIASEMSERIKRLGPNLVKSTEAVDPGKSV
jgi:coenzyme F420-reducing hydrogenase delta subunit